MGTVELVTGDSDLAVTVTPLRGVLVATLMNQTPVALADVQLAWFPPGDGQVITKVAPLVVPPLEEISVPVGYACSSTGPWRLVVMFRSEDGTEDALVCAHDFVASDARPGAWRSTAASQDLKPFLRHVVISLPPDAAPGIALNVIASKVVAAAVPLPDDAMALASIDPVVMVRLVPPGKIMISHGAGVLIPDQVTLAGILSRAGAVDHHRAYFQLGAGVSQLRLYLDLNWYVDETVATINRIHRDLAGLDLPLVLEPLIALLDKRETLKDLSATERQEFDTTIQKLERLICPP